MPYPKNLLNDGEELVLDRHPHWTFNLGSLVMIFLAVLISAVMLVIEPILGAVGAVLIVLSLLGSVVQYLRWKNIAFVVTTDRIITRQGILAKSGMEIPLDRIMNISYRQSLWERFLGTGDLVIESAGESGHQNFSDVANPSFVQNLIYRQSELYEAGRSGSIRAPVDGLGGITEHGRTPSIPEQIEKIAELRERGILSDEEFQAKKRTLLDRM